MSTRHRTRITAAAVACAAAATVLAASCGRGPSSQAAGGTGDAAEKVYVAPGQYDEFYAFLSGGFSGNLPVYGLPSGPPAPRHPGLLAVPGEGLRLQRADQADAEHQLRLHAVGRRASPRAVADRRRARRPLDLRQRQQHAARRPHQPQELRHRGDHRDPELRRQPLVAVRHPEHRIHRGRHPLQRPHPAGGRPDQRVQGQVHGHAQLHQGGLGHRPDGDRLPDR